MTKTHTCQTCGADVRANEAVLRTTGDLFNPTPRAWHRECYPETLTLVAQRSGDDAEERAMWARYELEVAGK